VILAKQDRVALQAKMEKQEQKESVASQAGFASHPDDVTTSNSISDSIINRRFARSRSASRCRFKQCLCLDNRSLLIL
jgi:hypothetical protein